MRHGNYKLPGRLIAILALFSVFQSTVLAAANQGSFTPTMVKMPIVSIELSDSVRGLFYPIYECEHSSTNDCVLDLTDNNEMANKLAQGTKALPSGNYDSIHINFCISGGVGYDVLIQGEVALGAGPTTYYTTSNGKLLSTVATDIGPLKIPMTLCSSNYTLPGGGLTLSSGSDNVVNLLVNLTMSTSASLGTHYYPHWCTATLDKSMSVCLQTPHFVALNSSVNPSIERYYLANDAGTVDTAGGQIILYLDNGTVIGGLARPLFSETSVSPMHPFETGLQKFTDNGDSTYTLETYDSGGGALDFSMVDFQRANHSASYSDGTTSYNYTIYKQ